MSDRASRHGSERVKRNPVISLAPDALCLHAMILTSAPTLQLTDVKYCFAPSGSGTIVGDSGFQFAGQTEKHPTK